jgi:hypothetical protein
MAGVTEKKKTGNYLLLHRSGAIAKIKSLKAAQPLRGLTAIINLETMEHLNEDQQWEKIPDGCAALFAAEEDEEFYEYEEEEAEEEDDDSAFSIQSGARRCFKPQVVWAYCKI